jgi:hypothetical protein
LSARRRGSADSVARRADKENLAPAAGAGDDRATNKPFERALSVRLLHARRASSSGGKQRRADRVPLSPVRRTQSAIVARELAVDPTSAPSDEVDRSSVGTTTTTTTTSAMFDDDPPFRRQKRNSLRWSTSRCF